MKPSIFFAVCLSISHLILLMVLISWFISSAPAIQDYQPTSSAFSQKPETPWNLLDSVNQTYIAFFFISGGHVIPQLQAYSVLSACRHHPQWTVLVYKRPWIRPHRLWETVDNLNVLDLNETELLLNTPLWSWYLQDWSNSDLYDYHLGDALRLAFLYKYGGIYLDTDVLVLKSFHGLPWNSVAYEDNFTEIIDGAVMKFRAGHAFLKLAMRTFSNEFEDKWAYQGPALMTRCAREYLNGTSTDTLTILPYWYFYPLSWRNLEIKKLFSANGSNEASLNGAYAVHLWNRGTRRLAVEKGSLIYGLLEGLQI